ncbi:MAG: 50S ribosomal protein L24 [bacterium]
MLSRVKKNDTVVVLSGKDKGKRGQVLSVDHKNETVLVKDACIVTRHVKAKKSGDKSQIVKEENHIPLCKVMPICPSCSMPCRIQVRFLDDSTKSRSCSRCKETF